VGIKAGHGFRFASAMPSHQTIVDESVSFGRDFFSETQDAAPHDWLQLTGGAIGAGIPLATGAAIGAPGRRIVNLQADGSALYSAQGCGRRPAKTSMSRRSFFPTANTQFCWANWPMSEPIRDESHST